ncbi:Vacuolar protein sorting-associated protein 35, partial [Podila epicladia]
MFPPLVIQAVKLARRFKKLQDEDEGWEKKCSTLFRFIHQVISILHSKVDNSDVVLRLFLLAGQSADECGFEDICYEFFVQAFTIYEESISESKAQFQAITLMVGTLQTTSCFNVDHYDTLITKCALHGAKLLKKPDQCRAVYTCSHLWWGTMIVGQEDGEESAQPYRDGKRVLECLQKALKIADSCMDSVTNVELFVEILNRYIYYFEKQNEAVTVKYLNGLIDLINTNLGNMENPDQHPPSSNSSSLLENDPAHISDYVMAHFRNTLYHLERRKEAGDANPEGCITDSIQFILTNFIEMNKLWVRLQHQGHSREREKREMERKELKILVGTNLVRLSQLDSVDLNVYQSTILPSVLEQIVSCKDVIAQEYLMEVIIQVFHDDFHLRTLGPFLSATAQLHPKVNVKQIVIALIDRLAAHAAREADSNDDDEEEEETETPAPKAKKSDESKEEGDEETVAESEEAEAKEKENEPEEEGEEEEAEKPSPSSKPAKVRKIRGIPEDVRLFEVFWGKIVELVKFRPDLSIQDITALLVSLINLSLSCYPDNLGYADQVLGFAKEKMVEFGESPDLQHKETVANLQNLLMAPIQHYPSILTLLELPHYTSLLALQPYQTRRAIAHAVVGSILKNETVISSPEEVNGVLEICAVMVRDQKDGGHNSSPFRNTRNNRNESGSVDLEEFTEEQGQLARIIHLFKSDDADVQAAILSAARKQFGDGGE